MHIRSNKPADVVLLDGDHNWYTVDHELRQIEQSARACALPLPVVACHDVGWPYGRRDLYYDPATVPEGYRQPYRKGGLLPGVIEPQPGKGLNASLSLLMFVPGRRILCAHRGHI